MTLLGSLSRVSRVTRAGALLVGVALLLWIVGSARAADASWLAAQPIEPAQAAINGLACPSPTTCLAASGTAIVQDGGPSYEPSPDPDPDSSSLNAVSCAPATRFCMFVDNDGGAFTYTSGTFGARDDMDGDVELDSVSCPSSGFCMAIDHAHTVFMYSGGSWDGGTTLNVPGSYTDFVNVSCVSSTFCVALASTSAGEVPYEWNGMIWSSASAPFDVHGSYGISLSCTSTTFCLETDAAGYASTFNGSVWSSQQIDSDNSPSPVLYSACVGTDCVAVDYFDNFLQTTDGHTWTQPTNIHAGTLISGIGSLACATATLCVAGDGVGNATTYAVPPSPGTPTLTGTPTVGQTLTLSHATVQTPNVWYTDDWRSCDTPDAGCSLDPISTSTASYALVAADANEYIDARETVGFGFDEEGPLTSNIVGPVSETTGTGGTGTGGSGGTGGGGTGGGGGTLPGTTTAGKAKLTGSASATSAGVVTVSLRCTGGPCSGKVKLTKGSSIGSAGYSITAGHTTKIKIKLTSAGKTQLKKHKLGLSVKLVITPAHGTASSVTIKLKLKR